MRHAGFIAAALLIVGCGPDPNAKLPFSVTVKGGATGNGGMTSTGGTTSRPGSGGSTTIAKGGSGGTSPFDRGGATGNGGVTSTGGRTSTRVGTGGATSTGGTTEGGTGGIGPFGSGGSGRNDGGGGAGGRADAGRDVTDGPVDRPIGNDTRGSGGRGVDGGGGGASGTEPCSNPTDVSGATTHPLGSTSEVCMRTQDDITGTNWGCSSFTGWTLKVNGAITECGAAMPAKVNGFLYFDFIPGTGAESWAAIYWFNSVEHPGPYPPWPG